MVEVVIAVGVAAFGIAVVLAMLPGLLQQNTGARHAHIALGMPDSVARELGQFANTSFSSLGANAAEFLAETSVLRLVAAEDGTDLRPEIADGRPAFFLVEMHRFPPGSQLSYDPSAPYLVLQARISWPHRPMAGAPEVPRESRQRIFFNVVVTQ